jgi:hypothetical protein
MYEGYVAAVRDRIAALQLAQLQRIDYSRLVRARGGIQRQVHGFEVGPTFRSTLPNASTPCVGAFASYGIDWHGLGARVRVSSCASQMRSRLLEAHVQASDIALQLYHAWDISWFTLELGLGAGLSLFHQSFATRGLAPSQIALAPLVNLGIASEINLSSGYYTRLGISGETHLLPMSNLASQPTHFDIGFVIGSSLGIGKRF